MGLVISSFLSLDDVTVAIPVGTKEEVLAALVDLLTSNHQELDRELVLKTLLKRETLRSTAIEQGVAFPHGRIPGLNQLRACFGRCLKGVDFASFDGKPTHFFFVLLIPEDAQGEHLKALARLNRLFMNKELRNGLLGAVDAAAVFRMIIEKDNSTA